MNDAVFFFGRLMEPELRAVVLGVPLPGTPARLCGQIPVAAGGLGHGAGLQDRAGEDVCGLLFELTTLQMARLERYMAAAGAQRVTVMPECCGRHQSAWAYLPGAAVSGERPQPWCFEVWQARHARASCLAAREVMAITEDAPDSALRARWAMAHSHAGARLRAAAEPAPSVIRDAWPRAAIDTEQERRPYNYFFSVAETDLRFRRFDGSWSPPVRRAGFVMSDAVTVLPYDPRRDRVLLIEQFRFGPWLRGAENCWLLEPIAGRIDAGETPQETALREALEEARLVIAEDDLVQVSGSYPSPGAVSEFIFHFVALCDLPDGVEGVAGLETEAEDIRSHLLPFDQLMELVATGEVQNGPLVLSAYWLALHRPRLRAET